MRSGASIGTTSDIFTSVAKHQTRKKQMRIIPTVSTVGPTMSPIRKALIVDFSRYLFVSA